MSANWWFFSSRVLSLVLCLSTLGKLRQCTPTLGRSLRDTFGFRISGILERTFRTFGSSSICFCRMHDPITLRNPKTLVQVAHYAGNACISF